MQQIDYLKEITPSDIEKLYDIKIENNYFKYIENNYFFDITEKVKEFENIIKQVNKILLKWYKLYYEHKKDYLNWLNSLFNDFLEENISSYLIWRYDCLIDTNGILKVIEINANTPWLITDVYRINKLLKPKWYRNYNNKFKNYILSKFKDFKDKKIWIVLANSFADEDFMVALDYKNILKDIIKEENIIIWDIYETNIVWEKDFLLKWEKIDVLINFCPLEYYLTDLDYANSFFNIIKNNYLTIYNPLESIILQDKLLFAIIYENLNKYNLKEQEIIKKHIPFTTSKPQKEDKFLAKYRWWRISRWTFDSNFDSNIDNIKDYIFQEKIISKKVDENWNFLVLWIFTDLKNIKWIITRIQKEFISNDETIKVAMCYKKSF